jgi:hypothetical protein
MSGLAQIGQREGVLHRALAFGDIGVPVGAAAACALAQLAEFLGLGGHLARSFVLKFCQVFVEEVVGEASGASGVLRVA